MRKFFRAIWFYLNKYLFAPIYRLFEYFFKHDIVVAIFIIILCLGVALFLNLVDELNITSNKKAITVSAKIADIIIASGFFAVILKALRLSNFFKEDLADVIYGKNFLRYTTEEFKEVAWKNVTDCLYESKFPALGQRINERIYREIIPDDLERHHKDHESSYKIRKLDDNHIEISHTDKYTIVSKEDITQINYQYIIEKSKEAFDLTDLKIVSFSVGGAEMLDSFVVSDWKNNTDNNNLTKDFTLSKPVAVPRNGELKVEIKVKTIQNKFLSLSWRKNFKLFTESATIFIDNDESNLTVDFQPFGNSRTYNEIGQPIHKNDKKNMEILFPGDGYCIFITIK